MDILEIDRKIQERFDKKKELLPKYYEEIEILREVFLMESIPIRTKKDIEKKLESLFQEIDDITNDTKFSFYQAETFPLIEKYKTILRKPQKVSFMGKKTQDNSEKQQVIKNYLFAIQKYANIKINTKKIENKKIICENCKYNKDFQIDENSYICPNCGTVQETEVHGTSYSDIDRVNMYTRYSYDRRSHFRECIYQYQGKQRINIEEWVYHHLEEELDKHDILIKSSIKEKRFKNVTKSQVMFFLKEIGYEKYENIHYIYWKLTGNKPDDISHLEEKLMNDFDILLQLYYSIYKEEQKVERSSFINRQHIFYQLLLKYNHPCNKEDFSLLKTVNCLSFHDEICEDLFKILGWNYNSFF